MLLASRWCLAIYCAVLEALCGRFAVTSLARALEHAPWLCGMHSNGVLSQPFVDLAACCGGMPAHHTFRAHCLSQGKRAALPSATIMIRQPIQRFQQMQASDIDIYRNEIRKTNANIVRALLPSFLMLYRTVHCGVMY